MSFLNSILPSRKSAPSRGMGLISYPKSGRTWFRVMLDELGVKVTFDHAGSDLKYAAHWQELDTAAADNYEKFAVLIRDPRDVVVSAFHHSANRSRERYSGSLSEHLRDPGRGIEKAARFNLMWRDAALSRGMLLLKYEAAHEDVARELGSLSDFLGQRVEGEVLRRISARNSFEAMQEREISGDYQQRYSAALGEKIPGNPNSLKVRKGKVGSYLEEMSREDVVYCEEILDKLSYFEKVEL